MRDHSNLLPISLADLHIVSQITRAPLDFDAVVEELLERGEVKDLVADGLTAVDGVLLRDFLLFGGFLGAAGLHGGKG